MQNTYGWATGVVVPHPPGVTVAVTIRMSREVGDWDGATKGAITGALDGATEGVTDGETEGVKDGELVGARVATLST